LVAGTYTITETQPTAYNDGKDSNGTPAGTLGNDVVSSIPLTAGTDGTGYLFGEKGTPITGAVYVDANRDSTKQPGEAGIPGVKVDLKNAAGTVIATTTTDANGNYSFPAQPAGTYTIEETQPAGYGSSENPTNSATVTVTAGQPVAATNFGETTASLTGTVFRDDNNDGIKQATEPGIAGVTVTVSGTDVNGAPVNKTLTTDANGVYSANDLKAGTYTITETQPTAYNDGKDSNGTPAGTLANDTVSSIPLGAGVQGTGYGFGETGNTINGQVFKDSNADNIKDPTENGIGGVTITLKDAAGNDIDSDPTTPGIQPTTTTTAPDGTFSFPNLPAGDYRVVETQPNGLGSSQGSPDSLPVKIISGDPTTVRFADTPSSISGSTYVDTNNNGVKDAGEAGIAGVTMTLTGTDANGAGVTQTTTSDANGNWKFADLLSGTYTVKETQPAAYSDGKDTNGSIPGTASNDQFSNIVVPVGTNATGYLFGESGTAIGGKVYLDANRNGADNSEPGIAGVTVELKDSTGATVATTTTAADGSFSFPPQVAGTYTVVETQPAGYGNGLQNPSNSVPVTVVANQPVGPVVFGEVNSSLSGTVYKDDNNDGIKDGAEFGIPGVTVTLTGTDVNGATVNKTLTTNAQGDWVATDLLAGTYTVTETQPTAYGDGKENPGTPAGVITVNDVISSIPLASGVQGVNYNFGERGTGISGVVYNDSNKDSTKQATEPGLGGVLVTLKDGNGADIDSDPTTPGVQPTTAITDGDGQYNFPNLPAGNYQVVETQPKGTGSSENPSNNVPVTLVGGTPKTVNFGDTFSSISGQVYNDANGNGTKEGTEPGLSGVTVTLTGTDANGNPVNRSALTDVNGDYSFKDLTTGTYTITETQPNAYTDGAETNGTPAGNITVNDVISSIPITTPATDAKGYLFGEKGTPVAGTVFLDRNKDGIQDPGEPGLPGVTLTLTPVGGGTPVTVVTDPNGNYTFGNLPAGDYTITETQPVGLGSSTPNTIPVKVTAGGVTPAVSNFGDTPASLAGTVFRDDNDNAIKDAGEPGIVGVTMTVTGTDANGAVNKTATTNAKGEWIVDDLKSGTYTVTETQPTAYKDGKDTNGTPTGTAANDSFSSIALTPGQEGKGYLFGELGTSINGKVFVDGGTKDGIQQPGEPGKPGVTITLKDGAGNVVATTTTGPDGSYSFPNLPAGNYTIEETQPAGFGSSPTSPNTVPVVLAAGTPGTANFGDTLSSFTGTVYNDLNDDGVKQAGEAGIPNVTVTLTGTDANGAPVTKTTTTDSNGNYSFPGLLSGTYTITETQPSAYNDGKDTNGTPAGTLGSDVISSIVLPAGTDGTGYLFGETGTPITGTVYKDNNLDGVKQPTEPGLPGVPVVLKNNLGTIVASTVTDANGNYSFPPQPAGTYTVEETQPVGYGSSENPTNSAPITVVAGQPVTPVNFGETPSSLSGAVFRDDNNDGIKQATEPGIPNTSILVTGTDVTGNNVSTTTTTDANGDWKVDGLKAGTYTITETQPTAYNDGKDSNGTPGGTLGNDVISSIVLPAPTIAKPNPTQGTGYNFGETGNTITGQVYKDSNADGTLDLNETGIPGVLITLKDVDGNDIDSDPTTPGVQPTTTITDANGKYSFPNLPAGNYKVVETQPNGLGSSTQNTVPVDVRNGNPTTVLFGDTPSSIAGLVFNDTNNNGIKDAGETSIAGVAVTLTGKDANNNPVSQTTTTDVNGDWKFGDLVSGTYTVKETQPASFIDGKDTDGSIASTISNDQFANIVLPIGTNATNYRFAEQAPLTGTVTGVVFNDTNGDGIQQPTEPGIPGIDVTLTPTGGTPIVVKTNQDGTYSIPNAPAGPGTINVTDPTGTKLTTNNDPQPVTVPAGSSVAATPVGYQPLGTINGKVFNDLNGDGKQDPNEPGIPGATVTVTTPDGKTITVITDKDGNYSVPNVPVGNNQVVVTKPDGTVLTTGNNPQTVPVTAGQAATATPVGFQGKGGLNGVVFEDKNGDKTQQPTEPGIAGAIVTIKDAAGNDIDSDPATAGIQPTTTTTDANGKYTFPTLPAGPVQVIVTPPAGYVTTTPERNPQTVTIPTGGTVDALPVGLVKPSIAIAKNVVQGDTVIPADQQRPEVMVGSTLRYQIKVTNDGVVTLNNIKVTDTLPQGLAYVPGSSSLVNSSFKLDEPVVTDGTGADKDRKVLTYTLPATLKLEPGQSLSLRLSTVVTPNASTSNAVINKAKASASAGSGVGTAEVNSDTAIAAVKVNLGVFQTPNVIVGRVYFDRNNDNNYTAGIDAPLPGARVYLSDGRFAVTDANGNYSIPEITPGVYAIRLDPITAPYPVKHVPDDQGAPGTRYVRTNDAGGIINEDFLLLEPSAAAVKARSTTVQRGPVTLNKSLIQGGAGYAVNEQITLEKAVNNLSITDPLPNSSAERGPITITNAAGQAVKFELSKDGKTISIPGTIPAGTYKIAYAIFTALPPDQVLTDPDIDYEEILLGAFPGFETSRTSDEVTR
jgi:large repetitive protein